MNAAWPSSKPDRTNWPRTTPGYTVAATPTQYGGLVLASHVKISGTDNGAAVALDVTSTINSIAPRALTGS